MLKFRAKCQCQLFSRVNVNTQCQCWPVVIDFCQCQWQCQCLDFPQCQCIEICQWLLTFYNRVNSSDLNVNSCRQSLTSLNVNGNVNDSKIVNLMSLVNVSTSKSQCQWYPQLHCSFLICHLLLKLVSTPLGPDPQGGDGPKTKAAQFYALQPNTKSASNLIFTTLIWLTPLMSLEPLESKLNHSNQIWRTLISFEEFLSDLNNFYQIWTTMIRLEPLYRPMFIRLAFSTMAFFYRD